MLHLNPWLPHSSLGTWAHYPIFIHISRNHGFFLFQAVILILIVGTLWQDGRTHEKCVLSSAQSLTQSKCWESAAHGVLTYLFLFLPALLPLKWTQSSETQVNDVLASYYSGICVSRFYIHQSLCKKSSGASSGQFGGAVMKFHSRPARLCPEVGGGQS